MTDFKIMLYLFTFVMYIQIFSQDIKINQNIDIAKDSLFIDNHKISLFSITHFKEDLCGDLARSSTAYIFNKGKVTKIIKPDYIEITLYQTSVGVPLKKPKKILLYLSGVTSDSLSEDKYNIAEKFLKKYVLFQDVELSSTNTIIYNEPPYSAIIHLNGYSLNYTLLKNRLGSFYLHNMGELDFVTECKYKNASRKNI